MKTLHFSIEKDVIKKGVTDFTEKRGDQKVKTKTFQKKRIFLNTLKTENKI